MEYFEVFIEFVTILLLFSGFFFVWFGFLAMRHVGS